MTKNTDPIDYKAITTVESEPQSQVTITGELPFTLLERERAAAVAHLGKDVKLDGFRQGHIPEKVLIEHIGDMAILGEMAERALAKAYPHILEAHAIDAIGRPSVEITKLASENPLGFKATVAILPEITLPDYKDVAGKLNKEKDSAEVTDADVEQQIKDIMRQKAAYERMQQKAAAAGEGSTEEKDAHTDMTELPTPESEAEKAEEEKEPDLSELTDDYVKTLGQPGQFESVDDFKTKVREHLQIEKEREVTAAHRAKITDAIIDESTLDLPQVLIDSELEQMFAQMNEDIARAGLKMEDYLAHIKKTEEEMRADWTPAAEKRAKLQLILNEIAKQENITPDTEKLESEVKHLLEHYKDADESRVRLYVASVLTNEAVMEMLEQK